MELQWHDFTEPVSRTNVVRRRSQVRLDQQWDFDFATKTMTRKESSPNTGGC